LRFEFVEKRARMAACSSRSAASSASSIASIWSGADVMRFRSVPCSSGRNWGARRGLEERSTDFSWIGGGCGERLPYRDVRYCDREDG
jgi:hypothetical protein